MKLAEFLGRKQDISERKNERVPNKQQKQHF
jgi:hypothetical protein